MKVEDVMTRDVITVAPGTSIQAAAQLMVDHGVSGLPVVDGAGSLVGLITEGDLIVRHKPPSWPRWWQLFFEDTARLAREYQRATGLTVGEVMTRTLVCIAPDAPLAAAAALLEEHRIRRLPVVEDGVLVGVISRADLIKTVATAPARGARPLTDAQLVTEMKRRLAQEPWVSDRNIVLEARDGHLRLWGWVESGAEKAAIETMARAIPGCGGVTNRLLAHGQVLSPLAMV